MIVFNKNLYKYDKHINFFSFLKSSSNLPQSIIIEGEEGIGKKNFIIHFILKNYLAVDCAKLSTDELFKNLIENKVNNIKVIQEINNNINIDQIRELLIFSSKSSFDDKFKLVLIFNLEDLNINAANCLLKILESPPRNTFFFLLKNSEKPVIKTIMSRCFKYNIKFSFSEKNEIFESLLDNYNLKNFNNFKIFNKYETPGSKINKILFLKKNNIENNSISSIIYFCISDYVKNKNFYSLEYGLLFLKEYLFNVKKQNLSVSLKQLQIILSKVSDSVKYRTDLLSLSSYINQIIK